ncbi:MAG: 50S ribosomal protein L32 [Clostridia bacterium]|nr:50S ribosomal protein L32 [Clostridia bacterium]
MAVPKRKTSKSRRDKRCANWKAVTPTLVECPHCKAQVVPHTVCKECGYYDGKEVIAKKAKKEKEGK